MKNSWTKTFRRLAAATVVAGTTAFSSAMCYAQIAFDNATDPVYNNGWQAGDNGGFGFGPWNFDGTYTANPTPPPSSINNPVRSAGHGRWAPNGHPGVVAAQQCRQGLDVIQSAGPHTRCRKPNEGTDIARAGRSNAGNAGRADSQRRSSTTPRSEISSAGTRSGFSAAAPILAMPATIARRPPLTLAPSVPERPSELSSTLPNGRWSDGPTGGNITDVGHPPMRRADRHQFDRATRYVVEDDLAGQSRFP